MNRFGQATVLAALVVAGAGVAQAQVHGIPFYPVPTGTGLFVSGDYGDPEGGGRSLAVTGGLGFSRFGITATAGTFDPGGTLDQEVLLGAAAGLHLFGGGLNPVAIGAQVGYGRVDLVTPTLTGTTTTTRTSLPAGLTLRVNPPLFPLKPFAVAYYQLSDDVKREGRVTVGANFNLLLGLGFHGAYDWGDSGSTWGVGAHFHFRLPSMPM
jgi:hypothetical protein